MQDKSAEAWIEITDETPWRIYLNLQEGKLEQYHAISLTNSVVSFDERGVITEWHTYWTDNMTECDDGHWQDVHGKMAQRVLRVHGPRTP